MLVIMLSLRSGVAFLFWACGLRWSIVGGRDVDSSELECGGGVGWVAAGVGRRSGVWL